jgi:hypothetical protein
LGKCYNSRTATNSVAHATLYVARREYGDT